MSRSWQCRGVGAKRLMVLMQEKPWQDKTVSSSDAITLDMAVGWTTSKVVPYSVRADVSARKASCWGKSVSLEMRSQMRPRKQPTPSERVAVPNAEKYVTVSVRRKATKLQ